MKKTMNVIVRLALLVLVLSCVSCASNGSHNRYRGAENWGAILGYTDAELRAMTPEQFQQAYIKSKAAADANASWAASESMWFGSTDSKGKKSFIGEVFGEFQKTGQGIIRDAGTEFRKQVRDSIRKK